MEFLMNIFPLDFFQTIDLYLNSDDSTKKSFPPVCRYFHYVAQCADGASPIHKFITKHYEFLKETSSVKEFTVSTIFRWNAILISEFHCSAYHRMINSQLVNMLWRQNTEIYLEADDAEQIPQVTDFIKSQRKCWDREKEKNALIPFYLLFDAVCNTCKSYLDNFKNDDLNFMGFLESYRFSKLCLISLTENNNVGIEDFYSVDKVEEICKEAESETDPIKRKKLLINLVDLLRKEACNSATYFSKELKLLDELRNLSLVVNARKSINSNMIPIIIGGHAHITSREVQKFSKSNGILCVALRPHNKIKNQKPVDIVTDICNAVDAETDEWSTLHSLLKMLRTCNDDPQKVNDLFSNNEQLFSDVKLKMTQYKIDLDQIMAWIGMPSILYLKEQFNLENR